MAVVLAEWRRVTICVSVVIAALLQRPGRLVADTKLDLSIDPLDFITRAMHLWEPRAAFGHVQNQAVGYLFPMAPFFLLADLSGIPMWIGQRLWWGALLGIAWWGTSRVAASLEIGTAGTRLVAGGAYALSPAMLSSLGVISGGQLPMALVPWALLPLVRGAAGTLSPTRAAARSALAVGAMGGINAISTLGALPIAAVFLLTRPAGRLRRRLALCWISAVAVATSWWMVPLLLQSRFGLDFAPFTESSSLTAAATSAEEVLRGSGYWLAHLVDAGHPWLPAGKALVTSPVATLATGALVALGLAGVAHRSLRERTFLLLTAGGTFVVMTLAYGGPAGSPLAAPVQSLQDGALAPLRNLHKFQPGLRLALALGLAHLLALTVPHVSAVTRRLAVAGAALLVLTGALPLLQGDLAAEGAFADLPGHWRQAAVWLDDNSQGTRSLIVPAAAFAEYRWGRPLDEPFAALARSPWAVRNLIPLGSQGNTQLLDAIDLALSRGQPVPGLAATLRGAGVGHLVVRNDLDPASVGAPPPAVIRSALSRTNGLHRVTSFGPDVPDGLTADQLVPDLSIIDEDYPSVEIWAVRGDVDEVQAVTLDGIPEVAGSPESALTVKGAGLNDGPFVIAGTTDVTTSTAVVTDDLRRRARRFGDVRGGTSHSLLAAERDPLTGEPLDPAQTVGDQSAVATVELEGARKIRASRPRGAAPLVPEVSARAAFDGDPRTAWIAAGSRSVGQWLEIEFEQPVAATYIDIRLLRDTPTRPVITRLQLEAGGVRWSVPLRPTRDAQRIALRGDAMQELRATLTRVTDLGSGFANAGIAEITIPGVLITSRVVLPQPPKGTATTTLLTRQRSPALVAGREDEEPKLHRRLSANGEVTIRGTATLRPGANATDLLPVGRVGIEATSRWEDAPGFAEERALDGNRATAWVASPFDRAPGLQLSWPEDRVLDSVEVAPARGPVRRPTALHLLSPAGTREVELDARGAASFEPLRTSSVTVIVAGSDDVSQRRRGFATPAAVGMAELSFPVLQDLQASGLGPGPALDIACGDGPTITVDGVEMATRLSGARLAALGQEPLAIAACTPLTLAGTVDLDAGNDNHDFAIDSLVIEPASPLIQQRSRTSTRRTTKITRWHPEDRRIVVGPGPPAILTIAENANDGWRARLNGRRLQSVTVDGWRQGYVLPRGDGGTVELRYEPGRLHRGALGLGAVGLLILVVLALGSSKSRPSRSDPELGRTTRPAILLVIATLGLTLVAGPLALLVPLIAALSSGRQWAPLAAGTALGISSLIAGIDAGAGPGSGAGGFSAVAQVLALAAMAAALATLAHGEPAHPAADDATP